MAAKTLKTKSMHFRLDQYLPAVLLLTIALSATHTAYAASTNHPAACTVASSNSQLLTCRGLSRSDWLKLSSQSDPIWTGLLVRDSPLLHDSNGVFSLWSDLSMGWRRRLESLAILNSGLQVLTSTESQWVEFPLLLAIDLSGNRFVSINNAGFNNLSAPLLRSLQLADNLWTELSANDGELIGSRFYRLRLIDFSQSSVLTKVTFSFGEALLPRLKELRDLRFNNCSRLAVWEWAPELRALLRTGGTISVKNTSAWKCSCEAAWLANLASNSLAGAVCAQPTELRGRSIIGLNFTATDSAVAAAAGFTPLGCSAPRIANFSDKAGYAVGDTARLLCRVVANPPACVTWTTNRGDNATMKPKMLHLYLSPSDTYANTFHSDHQWHWDSSYTEEKSSEGLGSGRILVLRDGSLYIDYVTRSDAGLYSCHADNGIGPGPVARELNFALKYEVLREVKKYGIIVGAASAATLLGIGFFIGLIRLILRKCSEEERKKQKSIKEMLEHLESYRGAKMEQFKECKDWLRAYGTNQMGNYNARVGKVKESCINNMLHMQETYNRRIVKIRDHCDCQMERLRESYNSQMGRIKDYKSSQVERVRDQYNQQLLRIKEYAANQLERLRRQYQAQQAYLMKVLESVSIDNCVSAEVEAMDEPNLTELGLNISPDLSDSEEAADDVAGAAGVSIASTSRSRPYRRSHLNVADIAAAAAAAFDEEVEDEPLEDFMTASIGSMSADRLDRIGDGCTSDDDSRHSVDDDGRAARRQQLVRVEVLTAPEPMRAVSGVSLPEMADQTELGVSTDWGRPAVS